MSAPSEASFRVICLHERAWIIKGAVSGNKLVSVLLALSEYIH